MFGTRLVDCLGMFWLALIVFMAEAVVFGIMIGYNSKHPFFIYDNTAAGLLLTAAAVILTGTAAAIAVAGWFGYREIRGAAIRAATEEAKAVAAEVAQSVATRVARETPKSETSPSDADQVARSYGEE